MWEWLILIADWKVMKMSDLWQKRKAIALVYCSKMTKFEIDDENERFVAKKKGYSLGILLKNDQIWDWLILIADWKVMKMSKLIDFDCRLKSDENERYLAKK